MLKYEIVNKLMSEKLVAILRKVEKDKTFKVIEALISGGIKCIELTLDTPDALELIKDISRRYSSELCIGAGTILDPVSCRMAILAGAEYIITPTLSEEVIRMCNMYGKPCVSGACTPTEILKAYEYGSEIVKVFPAGAMGTSFFKDIKGPLSHIPVMATGGVDLSNIAELKKAGADCFGIASSLVNKEAVKNEDYKKIEELAKQFLALARG